MSNISLFWEQNNQESSVRLRIGPERAVMNDQSEMLLDMLQLYAEHNLQGITTGNKSWFLYTTYKNSMFATSPREVMSRTKQNISAKKTMVTIFFTSTRLLVLNILPKGTKVNQDYFIDTLLPNLYSEKRRIARRKGLSSFSVHKEIQCAITAQRSLKNLRRNTLRELLTHLIHQTSASVTFGYLGS
jgi:hypothetical protein